jgi:hypothetical protein
MHQTATDLSAPDTLEPILTLTLIHYWIIYKVILGTVIIVINYAYFIFIIFSFNPSPEGYINRRYLAARSPI